MSSFRKIAAALLSVVLVVSLCIPTLSFASSNADQASTNAQNSQTSEGAGDTAQPVEVQVVEPEPNTSGILEAAEIVLDNGAIVDTTDTSATDPAADCTATIKYYENVTYEEPGIPADSNGRYFLGERTITGLTEGQTLDAWDYVINLEGFFFFDGWPAKLTVSSDPSQNVIELFYGRLWNSSYTVNYYMMENADLSADNWADALAPDDVTFTKFASATFENQPFGELVEGDIYEYKIDGAYAVDVYPPEIRVGTDTDNDTINVLYVSEAATLPDDVEIIEGVTPPSAGDTGSGSGSGSGGSASAPSDTQRPSGSVSTPGDQTFDKDEFISILPDSITKQEAAELFEDFIGREEADSGNIDITDEMASDTVDPAVAKEIIAAYNTGVEHGKASQEQCRVSLVDHIVCIIIMILLAILAIVFLCLYLRERKLRKQLEGDPEGGSQQSNVESLADNSPDEGLAVEDVSDDVAKQ